MIKYPSPEDITVIEEVANILIERMGLPPGKLTHVIGVRICDHCQDADEEAFSYYVTDRDGKEWAHLCNDCFDALGCSYDAEET